MKFIKENRIRRMNNSFKIKKYAYDLNSIAVINPYNFDEIFILENDILHKKHNKKEISKKTLLSTYIPLKYITTYELKISKNLIDKIDLDDHIEAHAYEELDLDETEKYIFKYKLVDSIADEKNITAEVIIVNEDEIRNYLKPLIEKYDYLDYLGYCGFLFEVLYQKNILTPDRDIFIYFTREFSVITLYADGTFLQNSIIKEGLYSLYENLNKDPEIEIKNFDYQIFIELITKKGLNKNYYDDAEEPLLNKLTTLFNGFFMKILNQINFLQRKFALKNIDRIFISTENGAIPGCIEFSMNHFGKEIDINELKFDSNYNPSEIKIDQLLFLTLLSTQYAYEKDYQEFNFTIKKRPPTFFYRKSGQFISLAIASLILSLLYPTYQYFYSNVMDYENKNLKEKLNSLTLTSNSLQNDFNQLLKSYKEKKEKAEKKQKYIQSIENIISTLYKEKKDYIPRSILFTKILSNMKKNNIHAFSINLDENESIEFNIFAKKECFITNFVNELVKKENLNVDTDGIIKDINSSKYISIIKVNL